MLFDSHAHINNENFTDEDRKNLIADIENDEELDYVMDVGFDLASSLQAVNDAKENDWCYAAVGVHPHDTESMDDATLALIKGLSKKDKVQAIGEIGLDFHYDFSPRDDQRYWFRKQIQLANELKMPIIIHSRDADQETMDILKEEGAFSDERKAMFSERIGVDGKMEKDARVLIHCFSGSAEMAEQYVKLGATISICGPVTFKNNKKTIKVVEAVPIEYLLVETDTPYLTPVPFRGKPNKPCYVKYTAMKVAEIKGLSYEEVAKKTCDNALHFYGIK